MAMNSGKYDNKQLNANTFGYADRNYDIGTAAVCKMFNQIMEVSIHLPKEGDRSNPPAFDYDNGVSAYLTAKDCKLFAKKIYKELEKYEEGKGFKTISLPLKKGVIEVTEAGNLSKKLKGIKEVGDPKDLCLVIYTNIDEKKIPQAFLVHAFSTGRLLNDYQPETGGYSLEGENATECEYFADSLSDFAHSMTNTTAHSIKNEAKYRTQKWEKMVMELSVSLGLDLSKSSPQQKPGISWNSAPSGDNSIASRDSSGLKTETIEADESNIEDIIKSMTTE